MKLYILKLFNYFVKVFNIINSLKLKIHLSIINLKIIINIQIDITFFAFISRITSFFMFCINNAFFFLLIKVHYPFDLNILIENISLLNKMVYLLNFFYYFPFYFNRKKKTFYTIL